MAISKRIRFEVFKRDSFICQYCGRSAPNVTLEVDHIEPISKGGTDDILNLITSCKDCNRGKSNIRLDENSVIEKRKKQLDELQERSEQLEMLLEWERGLLQLNSYATTGAINLWHNLVEDYALTDSGKHEIKRLVKMYGIEEVVNAIKISVNKYIKYEYSDKFNSTMMSKESVNNAFNKLSGILITRKRQKKNPEIKSMYYIKKILSNRLRYVNDKQYFSLFNKAVSLGVDVDDIQNLAMECHCWTDFKEELIDWIEFIKKDRQNNE